MSISNIINKLINNPLKSIIYIRIWIQKRLYKKKNVLIMIGADPKGEISIIHPGYKQCYVFEAHPKRYQQLKKKYGAKKNITIIQSAVGEYDGKIEFNISSNNDGASSSIGNFNGEWRGRASKTNIKMVDKITVPCLNIYNFCKSKNIDYIDDYISDIQGMDLTVLRTMKNFIEKRKIGTIKCEVTKDEYGNVYEGLQDNSESGFENILGENYFMTSKGFGILVDNYFEDIPDHVWEMDCKWKLR